MSNNSPSDQGLNAEIPVNPESENGNSLASASIGLSNPAGEVQPPLWPENRQDDQDAQEDSYRVRRMGAETPTASVRMQAESYKGIMPHPTHMEQFEKLYPGSTECFVLNIQEEAKHRREMVKLEMELHYKLEHAKLETEERIQKDATGTELSAARSEISSQTIVGMGAHFVAALCVVGGIYLCAKGNPQGGIAAFTAFGVIYTSGTIAGIFKKDGVKREADKAKKEPEPSTELATGNDE